MSARIILHAEDDPTEAFLLARTFKKKGIPCILQQVEDGYAAIKYLSGMNGFGDRNKYPFPDAVLLDLKMPVKDGFEVLAWVRQQQQFEKLPVIVLTSSDRPEDKVRAQQLGANAFVTKTLDWGTVLGTLMTFLGDLG